VLGGLGYSIALRASKKLACDILPGLSFHGFAQWKQIFDLLNSAFDDFIQKDQALMSGRADERHCVAPCAPHLVPYFGPQF
jgi:hypothetical protein